MSLLSYLFPRTIARFSTSYNRDIRIVEEQGAYKLLVNGSRQSGEYIKNLWQRAFADFHIYPSPDVRSILVLGVGGGTIINLLQAMYPQAKVTGVDIDEKMLDVGQKYFGLSDVTLIRSNAKDFVEKSSTWDLIVIDLFIGATIPPFVSDGEFLSNVRERLSKKGLLLINFLREYEYQKLSGYMKEKLYQFFSSVSDTTIENNRFFCVIK